jgi:hypothetical protein
VAGSLLGLTGCGGSPGVALSVSGTEYTERDFAIALEQINEYITGAGQFTAESLVGALVTSTMVDKALGDIGAEPITHESAGEVLEYFVEQNNAGRQQQGMEALPTVEEFNPLTLQAVHADALSYNIEMGRMSVDTEALSVAFQERLAGVDVTVNPRLGTWDPNTGGISPTTFPWLISGAAEGAPAE